MERGLDVSRTGALAIGHVQLIGTGPKPKFGTDCIVRVLHPDSRHQYRRDLSGTCQSLTWTRDGRRILVGTRTGEGPALWLIDPSADSHTRIDVVAPEPNFWYLSLHPDNSRLLFMAGQPSRRLNLIQVWGIQ